MPVSRTWPYWPLVIIISPLNHHHHPKWPVFVYYQRKRVSEGGNADAELRVQSVCCASAAAAVVGVFIIPSGHCSLPSPPFADCFRIVHGNDKQQFSVQCSVATALVMLIVPSDPSERVCPLLSSSSSSTRSISGIINVPLPNRVVTLGWLGWTGQNSKKRAPEWMHELCKTVAADLYSFDSQISISSCIQLKGALFISRPAALICILFATFCFCRRWPQLAFTLYLHDLISTECRCWSAQNKFPVLFRSLNLVNNNSHQRRNSCKKRGIFGQLWQRNSNLFKYCAQSCSAVQRRAAKRRKDAARGCHKNLNSLPIKKRASANIEFLPIGQQQQQQQQNYSRLAARQSFKYLAKKNVNVCTAGQYFHNGQWGILQTNCLKNDSENFFYWSKFSNP